MAAELETLTRRMVAEDYPELWEALTDVGKEIFAREVVDAFTTAAAAEDRGLAMGAVIEAWHRTFLIRQAPGYEEAAAKAREQAERAPGEDGERVYTIEELRDRLNLPSKT